MFGAFFHQDWDTEGKDWPDLVRNYCQGQPVEELHATAAELEQLLAASTDDVSLDDRLFRELGCCYDPRPDLGGPTVREWLRQVAAFLRRGAEQA
jgi:hypothetical protein